jgi:hypothetical protein
VDVRVITLGSMEDTEQVIPEVPISPIWAGQRRRGIYAIPNENQVVIIEFLGWNAAYPYVAGIWSDEYEAAAFRKNCLYITDGDGMQIVVDANTQSITIDNGHIQVALNGSKCSIKNGSQNLFSILDSFIQNVTTMQTVGSPAQHVVSPADIAKLNQDKADLAQVLEA